jgi:hypothetical protein
MGASFFVIQWLCTGQIWQYGDMDAHVDSPTDHEAAVDVIEHLSVHGYVTEVRWPQVDVVLESGTGITSPTLRTMEASLFWAQGLLNTGDRFIYSVTERNGEVTTAVSPDPNARERCPEEIDAMLERLMENARKEFACMGADSDETFAREVID